MSVASLALGPWGGDTLASGERGGGTQLKRLARNSGAPYTTYYPFTVEALLRSPPTLHKAGFWNAFERRLERFSLHLENVLHTVKKVSDFPVPSRDVTNQTLPGRE